MTTDATLETHGLQSTAGTLQQGSLMKRKSTSQLIAFISSLPVVLMTSSSLMASEVHASVSLTSSYYWRGYSKSDNRPSGQVNLDFSDFSNESGYFLGSWFSSIDFGSAGPESDAAAEMTVYGGWSQSLSDDVSLDLQLSYYVFDGDLFGENADYSELYLFLRYRDLLTAELAYAPDAYSSGSSTMNGQLTYRYPLHAMVDFSAGAGYFAARDVFDYDYAYWHAGLSLKTSRYSFDLRYFGSRETNEKPYYAPYYSTPLRYGRRELPFRSSAVVITLSAGFSAGR
jgi:uncharacterized protein (TIGR02001 family)